MNHGKLDVPGILQGSVGVRSVAEWGTLAESGFPCPGRGFGWLGFWSWGCSGWGSRLVHQGGARAGVPRPVRTVSISGSGLDWASLGMGDCGDLARFSALLFLRRRYLFLGHSIYPHF